MEEAVKRIEDSGEPRATPGHAWRAVALLPPLLAGVVVGCAAAVPAGEGRPGAGAGRAEVLVLSPDSGGFLAFSYLLAADLAERLGDDTEVRLVTRTRDGDAISGSMDILDAMARRTEGPVHYLGLTQSDVAYHFRHGGHPMMEVPHAGRDRVAALAKVFPERLLLYSSVPAPPGMDHRWELDDYQARWEALYLGEVGSGTLITAYNVFPILSARPIGSPPAGLRQLRRFPPTGGSPGERFGAALVTSNERDRIAALLASRGGTLIPLSTSQQRHLVSVYSQVYRARRGNGGGGGDPPALEIPALLVADRALPEAVAAAVSDFLDELDREPRRLAVRAADAGDLPAGLDAVDFENLFAAVAAYREERFRDLILPPHRSLVELPKANYLAPLLVAAGCLLALLALLGSCRREVRGGAEWLKMPRGLVFGVALALAVGWFHVCLAMVMWIERGAYLAYRVEVPSPFVERGYLDLLPALVHYTASGFSMHDLIPKAYAAQLVWLSIPFVLLLTMIGGSVHLVVPPIVEFLGKTLKGEKTLQNHDHVVLVHWHPYAGHVVRQLEEHARLEGRQRQRFLVVTPDRSALGLPSVEERVDKQLGPYGVYTLGAGASPKDRIRITVLERDPRSEDALTQAGVAQAQLVIVFPAPGHPEPDSVTAILLLRLQQAFAAVGERGRPKVLVWAQDPANVPLLMDERFGASDVCSMEWAWRVLCQATYVDAVSNVYRRLMIDTADSEELYELVLPVGCRPRTFAELLARVWEYNAAKAQKLEGIDKRNVVSLVGLARSDDPRKERIELCPEPQSKVYAGDRLLIITYQLDPGTRERLLDHLVQPARESAA